MKGKKSIKTKIASLLTSNYFLCFGIFELLRRKKIPITVETTGLLLNIINKDSVGSIWTEDKCIYVSELVSLTRNILLDQMISPVVGKNGMNFLGAVATDIWSKHDAANNQTSHTKSEFKHNPEIKVKEKNSDHTGS